MTLLLHEPSFDGLAKVISGGQCGADQGALAAAYELSVPTGGVAPKGWRTCQGTQPLQLAKYGLTESTSSDYKKRTRENVEVSDGTAIIATNPASPGSFYTVQRALYLCRPCLVLPFKACDSDDELREKAVSLTEWVIENRIEVLNVAGNRDKAGSTLHFCVAYKIVTWALLNLHMKGLLQTKAV